MNKTKVIICIVAVIFLLSALGTVYMLKSSDSKIVEIVQNGNVIYTFDLSKEKDRTFTIESADGSSSNTITIIAGQICVSEAECSDKTCVKTGSLKSEHLPIVCLPNKLIIRFCGE